MFLRLGRFCFSPPFAAAILFMSSSSQSSASASLVERIQFSSERDAVLARRDSLALGMGADAAHAWVMDLGAAVVRLCSFSSLPAAACFL